MSFSLPSNCTKLMCEIGKLIDFKVNFQPNTYFFLFSLVIVCYLIKSIESGKVIGLV